MRRPNFLIVGTAKSGSTSLMAQLSEHPEIYMRPGEVHFFDLDVNWDRGVGWYERQFDGANDQSLVGDKTPSYSYLPHVPRRIRAVVPDAKLLWILREPVSRAYSNYWHSVSFGKERLDFASAVRHEEARVARDPYRGYLARGRYAEQFERFLDHFPREQMHVVVFEEYVQNPRACLGELASFLGVRAFRDHLAGRRENLTRIPRSRTLEWAARTLLGPGRAYRAVRRLNRRSSPGYPPLDPALRVELTEYFAPHNERLERILGRRIDVWRAAKSAERVALARQ